MTLTFKQKDLFFSPDLSHYVSYQKNNHTFIVDQDMMLFLTSVEADSNTPSQVKAASQSFFSFITKNSKPYGGSATQSIGGTDCQKMKQSFFFEPAYNALGLNIEDFWKRASDESQSARCSLTLQHLVPGVPTYDTHGEKNVLSNPSASDLAQYIRSKKRSNLLSSHRVLGDNLKLPRLEDSKNLSDNTRQTLHEKIDNHTLLKEADTHLKTIEDYVSSLSKEQFNALMPHPYRLRLPYSERGKSKINIESQMLRVSTHNIKNSLQILRKNFNSLHNHVNKHHIDLSAFIQKPWTGSLQEENSFSTGVAFYIIAVEKKVEGFVGYRANFNRYHSSPFTVVKDIKNAYLFTEGAKYELGYELEEKDKLYVDLTFQRLGSKNTQLAQSIDIYMDKNKIVSSMPTIADPTDSAENQENAAPRKSRPNKI